MTQRQIQTAAYDGLGQYKSAGANLADTNLLGLTGLTAFPNGFYGTFTIKVTSGTLYITIDGTAATANGFTIDAGETFEVKNCNALAGRMRFFANATYDARVLLYAGGTP